MKRIVLEQNYTASDFQKHYGIEFVLPCDAESMEIACEYDRTKNRIKGRQAKDENYVDIALIAPNGEQIGYHGDKNEKKYISAAYSSPGYKTYNLKKGVYVLTVGVAKVKRDGMRFRAVISYTPKESRWMAGDCHLHSINSDGRYSVKKLIRKCRQKELLWGILTDHNVNTSDIYLPKSKKYLLIAGEELTGYYGHINFWGVKEPFRGAYMHNGYEDMSPIITEAEKNGAVLSLNHPGDVLLPWKMPYEDINLSCIEVWNGPMRPDNMRSLQFWVDEILKGKRVYAVGGSDFHRDFFVTRLAGIPTTVVYAKSLGQDDILEALVNGRSFVTSNIKTKLFLNAGGKCTGQTTDIRETVTVTADKLKRRHKLVVYNNDKVIYSHTAKKAEVHTVSLTAEAEGFIRAEIRYGFGGLRKKLFSPVYARLAPDKEIPEVNELAYAISNPIWVTETQK